MSSIDFPVANPQALSPPRRADGCLPYGFRIVHVPVPEAIFNHAKAQAYLSGLRFAVYVAKVLSDARPYPSSRSPQETATALAPTTVVPCDPPAGP